jgi:molybdopterin-binding protein
MAPATKFEQRSRVSLRGDVMSLVKFTATDPHEMASVITTESVNHLKLKKGEEVELIIDATFLYNNWLYIG